MLSLLGGAYPYVKLELMLDRKIKRRSLHLIGDLNDRLYAGHLAFLSTSSLLFAPFTSASKGGWSLALSLACLYRLTAQYSPSSRNRRTSGKQYRGHTNSSRELRRPFQSVDLFRSVYYLGLVWKSRTKA